MTDAINPHARTAADGRKEYPTMHGDAGWYGWQPVPWSVGALETWYWSQRADDRAHLGGGVGWLTFLDGRDAAYPERLLRRDLASLASTTEAMRRDRTPPAKRLADNMLDLNPATTTALVQLMLGALNPSREGGLLNARLRYFDSVRRRAGVPEDVAALVSKLRDARTVVTLVNLGATESRTVIVQGGAYGEHQIKSVECEGRISAAETREIELQLTPGAGARLTLAMRRYANPPTVRFPWAW